MLSRDCGLVSLGHLLGTGVVRKAPARDVLMVLGVAVAWTPLAVLVSSTIFINIMVPPLVSGDDLDPWKVRDARDGVMPQPLLTQTQMAATETWHPMVQAGPADVAPMDFDSSGLNGSTHDIKFTSSFARECDSLICGCVSALCSLATTPSVRTRTFHGSRSSPLRSGGTMML